jgi:hypothetical protein
VVGTYRKHETGGLRHGIELTIESGAGLATNERNEQGPFVKAQITGGSSMITGNKDPSGSPIWNEAGFLPCDDWSTAVIMFDVFERDSMQTKLIGCGLLDLATSGLRTNNSKRLDVVLTEKSRLLHNRQSKGGSTSVAVQAFGTLGTLRVRIVHAKKDPHKARKMLSSTAKEKAAKLVTIDVVEARYLSPMDANGKADPYCILSVGSKTEKTKTQKETLEPNWRERFDFMVKSLDEPLAIKVRGRRSARKSVPRSEHWSSNSCTMNIHCPPLRFLCSRGLITHVVPSRSYLMMMRGHRMT